MSPLMYIATLSAPGADTATDVLGEECIGAECMLAAAVTVMSSAPGQILTTELVRE